MKKTIMGVVFLSCAFLLSLAVVANGEMSAEQKGLEIAKKYDKTIYGFIGEEGQLKMTITNAFGDSIARTGTYKRIEMKNDGIRTIVAISWPPDVKGTKLLTWVHKHKNNSQWLYIPAYKKIKRISGRSQSGSFLGSEFSYEDLGDDDIAKYDYKYLRDETMNGRKYWLNERRSKDKDTSYSKQITYIDQINHTQDRIDYYDRKGELLKTLTSKFVKISGIWRVKKSKMVNHQTSKESTVELVTEKIKIHIPTTAFMPGNLGDL